MARLSVVGAPGGTLLFIGGTGGRSRGPGLSLIAAATGEMAPVSVSLISPASSTPRCPRHCSATTSKHAGLSRATLPIGRVVGPPVAALAVHIMTNTALTGATYDIDGGQQLIPALAHT